MIINNWRTSLSTLGITLPAVTAKVFEVHTPSFSMYLPTCSSTHALRGHELYISSRTVALFITVASIYSLHCICSWVRGKITLFIYINSGGIETTTTSDVCCHLGIRWTLFMIIIYTERNRYKCIIYYIYKHQCWLPTVAYDMYIVYV